MRLCFWAVSSCADAQLGRNSTDAKKDIALPTRAFMLPLSRREIRACRVDAQLLPHRRTCDQVVLGKSRFGTTGVATGDEAEWTPCCHVTVYIDG